MKDIRKLIGAGLLVLASLLLTFKFKAALGWSPDFILPVLVVSGFFLDIYALAFLVLMAIWVINWQAGLPVELWIMAVAPFVAWFGKRFMPSAPWFTLAVVIGVGDILIYVLADAGMFLGNLGFILSNVSFAVLFGLALMTLLEWVYEER
jgi:hypothetical protein